MIRRLLVLVLLSIIALGGSASFQPTQSASPEPCAQDHDAWLRHVLEKMETIKPGMTRVDLLKVFKTDDGPPTGRRGTFFSRECPQFRVDVEFKPAAGNVYFSFKTSPEDYRDIIVKVSKPYLQSKVRD
jgi:hypothetical protein